MESTRNDVAGVWHYRQPTTARPADFLSFFYHQESVNEESSDNKRNTTPMDEVDVGGYKSQSIQREESSKDRGMDLWLLPVQKKGKETKGKRTERTHTVHWPKEKTMDSAAPLFSWSWRCSSSESLLFQVKTTTTTTKGSNGIPLSTKPCGQGPIKVSALLCLYRNLSWPKVNKKIHIKNFFFAWGWFCVCGECVLMKRTKISFKKKKKKKPNQISWWWRNCYKADAHQEPAEWSAGGDVAVFRIQHDGRGKSGGAQLRWHPPRNVQGNAEEDPGNEALEVDGSSGQLRSHSQRVLLRPASRRLCTSPQLLQVVHLL